MKQSSENDFAYRFFKLFYFSPNITDHDSKTPATKWILQHVCQFALPVGDVSPILLLQGNDGLLQKRQWFVNVSCLFLSLALWQSFT